MQASGIAVLMETRPDPGGRPVSFAATPPGHFQPDLVLNTANSTFDIHATLTPPGTTNTLFVLDIKKSWPGLIWIASDEIWPIEENLQRRFVPHHTASCFQQKGLLRFPEHNLSWSLFARLSAGLDRSHRGLCPDPSPARAE